MSFVVVVVFIQRAVLYFQTIEVFLVRSVSLVVSDRVDKAGYANSERHKWVCASGGSGGPRSLRSVEVTTPTPTPPTPLLSSLECPSSNSANLRGQTTQRSVSEWVNKLSRYKPLKRNSAVVIYTLFICYLYIVKYTNCLCDAMTIG